MLLSVVIVLECTKPIFLRRRERRERENPMSNNTSIDFDNLPETAIALIEKIEAVLIDPQSEISTVSSYRRVEQYWVEEEARRQQNIENITLGALPYLNQDADPDAIAEDWIAFFIEKSQRESDAELQNLWSRILAREANVSGTFSVPTVNFFSELDEVEIELFTELCGFACEIEDTGIVPLVFSDESEIYNRHRINRETLTHLDAVGLVEFQRSRTFRLHVPSKYVIATYYGQRFRLVMPKDTNNELDVGTTVLTEIGQELAPICEGKPVEGFYEYLKSRWG